MSSEKITVVIDEDLEDLIPGYMDNRRADIKNIKAALGSADFETIRILGHSMKGSGGGYGFDPITDIGASLEEAAKASCAEEITKQTEALSEYINNIEVVYE
jgi:HPt (histidine-containing phosphotransfer) domain-containing protein